MDSFFMECFAPVRIMMKDSRFIVLGALLAAGSLGAADSAAEVRRNLAEMPRPWRKAANAPAAPENEDYGNGSQRLPIPKLDAPTYEKILAYWAKKHPHVKLEEMGRSPGGLPLLLMTISDFTIPDDEKFNIAIVTHHVGGEHSAFYAMMKTLEFLVSPEAEKYRKKYQFSIIPVGNPDGFFKNSGSVNLRKGDPYTGGRGSQWNIKELTVKDAEVNPELIVFTKVLDRVKPELLFDWHGASRQVPGHIMIQYLGGAASNHALKGWADNLLAAAMAGSAGSSPSFPIEREIQRMSSVRAPREAFPGRFRDSGDYFYSDMYPYLKYHTMPIIFEIGYEQMALDSLLGVLEFGMTPPAELNGSLPVDNIATDWAGMMIRSYGRTPGEKRRSRVELWSKLDSLKSYCIYPETSYLIGKVVIVGPGGEKRLFGDCKKAYSTHIRRSGIFASRPDDENFDWTAIRQILKLAPKDNLTFAMTDMSTPPETGLIQNGITFATDIQIPNRYQVKMLDVRLNGKLLAESETDGWQLVKHDNGFRLFVHVPPEKAKKLDLFFFTAGYTSDAPLAWGWQPSADLLREIAQDEAKQK